MMKSIVHEFYKLSHQKMPFYGALALLGLMLYTSIPTAYITKSIVAQGFGVNQWVIIIMIAMSSNLVMMEYRDHTMPTLLYKSPNRVVPYVTKLIALIAYSIFLMLIGIVFAFLFKMILAHSISWSSQIYHQTVLVNFGYGIAGTAVYLLFTITLSLMLVALFKSNAIVIIIGLVIAFFGANLSAILIQSLPGLKMIIAWGPLNMINIIHPVSNLMAQNTICLSNIQLVVGNLVYSLIFLLIGISVFKHGRV